MDVAAWLGWRGGWLGWRGGWLGWRAAWASPVIVWFLVAGCSGGSGGGTTAASGAVPIPAHGTPTPVDVCGLVSSGDTSRALGRTLHPVGLEYSSAKVATLQCELGQTFAAPLLSVALAIGPISADVFNQAYGESAGGDPAVVTHVGQTALLRKEAGQMSLHVLIHSSILTVSATIESVHPPRRAELLDLARSALSRLPSNPVLVSTKPGPWCSDVPLKAVASAIGARPSLSSEFDADDGSFVCSWTALPGAAVVTVFRSPEAVASYEDVAETSVYHPVSLADGSSIQAMSRNDRAGDLLIVTGHVAVLISVMPTAGFSDRAIMTTPGETVLARAVVAALT